MSKFKFGVDKLGLALCAVLTLAGLSACSDAEEPAAQVSEAVQAEKLAPAPQGAPAFTVYFDAEILDQSESTRRDNMWLPPIYRSDVAAIAAQAQENPQKNVLLTTYFNDKQHEVNNADYARMRANAVRNAIAGEGLLDARIASNTPVLAPDASARDANRVEVRLQ